MEKLISKLSEYGVVRTCKLVHDDVFTLVMTDGFSENSQKTFKVMLLIQKANPDLCVMETCITEENFCCMVLKRPQA